MIYLASTGNDLNPGTIDAPVLTLGKAYTLGSSIYVVDNVTCTPYTFAKTMTITGSDYSDSVLSFNNTSDALTLTANGITFTNIGIRNPLGNTINAICNNLKFKYVDFIYHNNAIVFNGMNLIVENSNFEGQGTITTRSMITVTGLNDGCIYISNSTADIEASADQIRVLTLTGSDLLYGNIMMYANDFICPNMYDVIYIDNWNVDVSSGLNLNIVSNEFSAGTCVHNKITNTYDLAGYELINIRNNTLTGPVTAGLFFIDGVNATLTKMIATFIFEGNAYTTDFIGGVLYNNTTLITGSNGLSFPTLNVTLATDLKYYPYLSNAKMIEKFAYLMDEGTLFSTSSITLAIYFDSVVIAHTNLIMTLTIPTTGHIYLAGAELTNTAINSIIPAFLFSMYEYDSNGVIEPFEQTLSFYFIPITPFTVNDYHLFYHNYDDTYTDTWIKLVYSSTYIYTASITHHGEYAAMNPMKKQHALNNIYCNSLSFVDGSIGGTTSSKSLAVNKEDGITNFFKTKINDNTAIGMDISNTFSLAVTGIAYLSTSQYWTTGSDYRVKENIIEPKIDDIKAFVKSLQVYEYEYDKRYQDDKGKKRVGLIAQEVLEAEKKYIPTMKSMVTTADKIYLGKEKIVDLLAIDTTQLLFYITLCLREMVV